MSSFTQIGLAIDGEAIEDRSGRSISLSSDGTILAIGANLNDSTGLSDAGHTRIYEWSGTAWNQLGSDINGEVAGDLSGSSVSLSSSFSLSEM